MQTFEVTRSSAWWRVIQREGYTYRPSSMNSSYIPVIYHCKASYNEYITSFNMNITCTGHYLIIYWPCCVRYYGAARPSLCHCRSVGAPHRIRWRTFILYCPVFKTNASANRMRGSTPRKIRNNFMLAIISSFTVLCTIQSSISYYEWTIEVRVVWIAYILSDNLSNFVDTFALLGIEQDGIKHPY